MLRDRVTGCLFGLILLSLLGGEAVGQERAHATRTAQGPALAPQRPGETDVYILSMGLWGAQGVFESEAKGAARILEARFDAKGRSIVLFNSRRRAGVTDASATAAASAIGRILDPVEDVAVVVLTSHGTPEGLAVTTQGRNVQLVPPDYVRDLLASTRARLRVLIVSACYSGIFAKALADDDTLVITAAAADRPSFGCEDRATWTYFGDAFFNRALRAETRLDQAFLQAKVFVTRRERQEGFEPSNPQMAGGARVLERLQGRSLDTGN